MILSSPTRTDLTIAIATYGARVEQAIKLALTLQSIAPVTVFHQTGHQDAIKSVPLSINYVPLFSIGVTKSRNAALSMCESRFVWFLDDDVSVELEKAKLFISNWIGKKDRADIVTVGVTDEDGAPRKSYKTHARRHSFLSILSVGTIEIFVDRERVVAHRCSFPPDMGAGSQLPSADEPVFLAECMKSGLSIEFVPAYFITHPRESSGNMFCDPQSSRARGVAFRRIYGITVGYVLLSAMYVNKVLRRSISIRKLLGAYINAVAGLVRNQA